MMKANHKYGQLLVKAFENYKNLEYLNPHDEIKCIKNDIRVKVRRQDSTYQDVHLGDILSSSVPGPGPRSSPGQVSGQVQKVQGLRT